LAVVPPAPNALTAGAIVEDFDIYDINHWLTQTLNESILTVFGNLVSGSGNHLNVFASHLERFGIEYDPEYISHAEYQTIIDAGHQNC